MAPVDSSTKSHSHRPATNSVQTNKKSKSRHASKGSLKDLSKGRTHRPTATTSNSGPRRKTNASIAARDGKRNRRNNATQLKLNKDIKLGALNELFTRKGEGKVARIVAVIPLTQDVSANEIIEGLLKSVGIESVDSEGVRTADVVKFHNQSLRFLILPPASSPASLFPILDACAAADFVIIGLSSTIEVDEQGETALRCLTGSGIGSSGENVFGVVTALPESNSLASTTRFSLHSFLTHFFPSLDRISNLASTSESSTVIRSLCDRIPKGTRWREARPRVLAEDVKFVETVDESGVGTGVGTMMVEGIVRGSRLGADRLVHLQGWGDFTVEKITSAPSTRSAKDAMVNDLSDLSLPNPEEADDLVSINIPDDADLLLGEQTWPTEEEMNHRHEDGEEGEMLPPALPGTTPRRVKRVPKGTSSYQAAWIIDDEDGEEVEEDDEEDEYEDLMENDEGEDDDTMSIARQTETNDDATTTATGRHADLSPEEEAFQLEQYLQARSLERRDDLEFPDEVDTPLHIPARERFARFRGMKSFRTSKWDPYEELPIDFSKCFALEDWKGMGRRMEKKVEKEGVEVGTRVILHIANVPLLAFTSHQPSHPFLVFGLLKHEHKYSIMHFHLTRSTEYTAPVKSKDSLLVMIGPRRFVVNPIWSEHTMKNGGRGSNNVHKFLKFFEGGIEGAVGSCYLPITFGSSIPVVCLKLSPTGSSTSIDLVGTGTLLSSDPTRITAKRKILTGHPFKVHKKTATIRYMFFNPLDILYYAPIELRTKSGRVGWIKESLGTHGYFKASFDGSIDQMEVICLRLYKRVFYKWGEVYRPLVAAEGAEEESRFEEMEMA